MVDGQQWLDGCHFDQYDRRCQCIALLQHPFSFLNDEAVDGYLQINAIARSLFNK